MTIHQKLAGISLAAVLVLGVTTVAVTNGNMFDMTRASGNNSYSCASLHFGMNDNDFTGTWSGSGSTWAPIESVIKVKDHTTHDRVFYSENNALKFNNGSNFDGTISITFDYNITECVVYAAGWKDKNPTLSVNGIPKSIAASNTVSGSTGSTIYTPYRYILPSETNVLTLSATDERLVVGDIALRITSYVDEDDPPVTPTQLITAEKSITTLQSENSWTIASGSGNQPCYTSFNLDSIITISTSGSKNCGSVWNNGTALEWRLYQAQHGDVTVEAASGYKILSIIYTYGLSNGGSLYSGSTNYTSGTSIAINASSKTLTVGSTTGKTNGQVKITNIKVIYQAN